MSDTLRLQVNGIVVDVPDGASVAAAIARVATLFRRSGSGEPRAPLCGMGICFECRVTIDGSTQMLSCVAPARDGMIVCTDE